MQDLNDKYSGIYRDRDPIPDRRVNEIDDRLVKAEKSIQALKKGMEDGVNQLEYERLYKRVKDSLGEVGEGILVLKKELDYHGSKIIENTARIDVTTNLIRLSVEASERDTLSKALEESKAMFEILANQITSEVTQRQLDEMGIEIYNMKSSIIQTAESVIQTVSREQTRLDGKVDEMSTSIFQSAQEIVLLANRVTGTETGVFNNSAQIQLLADEINLSIHRDEFDLLGLQVATNKSNIQILSDEITLSVREDIFNLGARMSTAESAISLLPGEIELRVKTVDYTGSNIVSLINLQPDTVKIQAKNINLFGSVTFNDLDSSVTDKILEGELAQDYVTNVLPGLLDDISNALDGLTEQHFENYDPTTTNLPASDWTTLEMKETHLGDLFYNTSNGKSFRWVREGGVFIWQEIINSDLQAALDAASKAQDTADSKRRVFTVTPFVPYDVGDMWSGGPTGDLKRAVVAKAIGGSYDPLDWVLASKYTDNTRAIEAEANAKAYADSMKLVIDGDIADVNTALDDLDTTINTTFLDGVINSAEALSIKSNIEILNTERAEFFSRYNSVYINIQLTGSAKTNLFNAWNAYNTAHTNLVNSITTSTADGTITPVEKADVTNKFTEYKNNITTLASRLEVAIDTIAQAKADDALDKAGLNAKNLMAVVPFEGGKKFNNPASYSGSGTVTGMLVINTPITSAYMCKVKITGYNYNNIRTDIDLLVDFYSYTGTQIINPKYTSSGNYLIDNVRIAHDSSGRVVILVQNVGSTWEYPKIQVEWAIVSFTEPPDTYKDGWSMTIQNSLPPGLVGLVDSPGVDSQSFAVNLYNKTGIGTLPSGKTIITGGKITTDLLVASEIQSTVVTAAYINSLNIVAGSIRAGVLTIGAFTVAQQNDFNSTKSTANTANSTANTAYNNANTAQGTANSAASTANTANANAANAKAMTDYWAYNGTTEIHGGRIRTGTIIALGNVTAGSFSLGSGRFVVDSAGNLSANNVNLSGVITATSGSIGNWSIQSAGNLLYNASGSGRFLVLNGANFYSGIGSPEIINKSTTPSSEPLYSVALSALARLDIGQSNFGGVSGGNSNTALVLSARNSNRNIALFVDAGHIYMQGCLREDSSPSFAPKATGYVAWVDMGGHKVLVLKGTLPPSNQ